MCNILNTSQGNNKMCCTLFDNVANINIDRINLLVLLITVNKAI